MNIVDMYRIKNNQFNWSELFVLANEAQLNVIHTLLIAEIQGRSNKIFNMPKPTPYSPNGIWSDKTWQIATVPDTVPVTSPGIPNRNGNVYIGDPMPGLGGTADIRVMFDGQVIGNVQSISSSVNFNDHTVATRINTDAYRAQDYTITDRAR